MREDGEKKMLSVKEWKSQQVGKRRVIMVRVRFRVRQKYDEEDFPNVDLKNT